MYAMGIAAVQLLFKELDEPPAGSDDTHSTVSRRRNGARRGVVILEPQLIVRKTS